MNEALAYVVAQRMERTAAALRKNNMEAYCVKTADEVVPLVKTLLAEGATVGAGGSMTLEECGVMDLLRSGAYHFLDRGAPGLTPEDCESAFVPAAAWMVLAWLQAGESGVSSFTAGDLTIHRTGQGMAELTAQAERLMAPYLADRGFSFQGGAG